MGPPNAVLVRDGYAWKGFIGNAAARLVKPHPRTNIYGPTQLKRPCSFPARCGLQQIVHWLYCMASPGPRADARTGFFPFATNSGFAIPSKSAPAKIRGRIPRALLNKLFNDPQGAYGSRVSQGDACTETNADMLARRTLRLIGLNAGGKMYLPAKYNLLTKYHLAPNWIDSHI